MKTSISSVGVIALVAFAADANADWVVTGAAYSCNRASGTFTLRSTIETSESSGKTNVPARFKQLGGGITVVSCELGPATIQTRIEVFLPQERGVCAGRGSVYVHGMSVHGTSVLSGKELGPGCMAEKSLTSVQIATRREKLSLRRCYEITPQGAVAEPKLSCTQAPIPLAAR